MAGLDAPGLEDLARDLAEFGVDLNRAREVSSRIHRFLDGLGYSEIEVIAGLALAAQASRWAARGCGCTKCLKREAVTPQVLTLVAEVDRLVDEEAEKKRAGAN